jgi:hypothetical protein
MTPRRHEQLLNQAVEAHVRARYGPVGRTGKMIFVVNAAGRVIDEHFEILPLNEEPEEVPTGPRHSEDFRSVHLSDGTYYRFSGSQAAAIGFLWRAWESGCPDVGSESILEACGSEGNRVRDIFSGGKHPAWGTFVQSPAKGIFRLVFPEAEDD